MALIDLNFEDAAEEEEAPPAASGSPISLQFAGEEHLSESRPPGVDGEMYADPYSNLEKMGERLSTRWGKTKAGLGAMAANQEMPTSTEEMAEGVLPPVDGDWKDWAMYSPHGEMLNQVSSMVMSGVVDVGDMVRRGDLREDLRTANKIVREEADRTLGADYMQYEGNVGQKFGWDVAEATVNMGGALAVGWATRNPGLALGVIAGEVGGTAYTDYLGKTGSHDRAMAAAKFHTYAEIIPETIPVLAILRKTGAGDGMRRFLEATVGEGAQELITSILTQTYDAKELENMSLKEAILNIDWGDVAYEGLIGTFVGGILSTPGSASDYIQYKAAAEGKPPPSGPAPPDFDVKPVEENQTAIDEALAETPNDPVGDFEPGESGPEIEVEAGSIVGEPVLTETEQAAQDMRDQLDAADAEETVKTPDDIANDEWVAEQLRAQGYGEEEIQAAIVANKPQTKQDMGWVAPVEEGESEAGPTAPINPDGSLTPIDGKILPDPRDAKGDAWVAPEDVEPASTPAPMTPVPEQKQPDDERGGMLSEPAELPPAEPWGPVDEGKTDEITRDELIATTENVETTGEAVQVSEEYRTARPEFKDLVLSFKPGDDRHGTEMEHYYGEVGGTEDADGMPIDVMLNKDYKSEPWLSSIFVINQMDPETKEFKQHKVMAGFAEMEPAERAYMNQWGEDSWDSTFELTPEEFEEWRATGDHQNAFEPYEKVPDDETAPGAIAPSSGEEVSASDAASVSPDDFDAMLEDAGSVEPIGRPQEPTLAEHEATTVKDFVESGEIDTANNDQLARMLAKVPGYQEETGPFTDEEYREEIRAEYDTLKYEDELLAKSKRAKEQAEANNAVSETDDLITFLRKKGGINVDNQSDITAVQMEGLDDEKRIGLFNLAQHGDKGMQVDEAAGAAMEAGYIDEHDIKALADKIDDARQGPVYNAAGMDADMARQQDAENERLQLQDETHQQELIDDADDMAAYMIEQSGGPRFSSEDIPELIGLAADVDYGAVQDVTFDNTLSEDEVRTKLQAIIDGEYQSEAIAADETSEGATETTESPSGVPEAASETETENSVRGVPITPRMAEAIDIVGREEFTKRLKKRGNRNHAEKGSRVLGNIADGLAAQIISENWSGAAPEINDNGHINRDNAEWMNYEGLKKDRTQTNLSVIQISENLWSYGHSIMGKNAGSSSGISLYSVADSKQIAQMATLRTAQNFWEGEARDKNDSVSSKASRAEASRALKWVNEQIDLLSPEVPTLQADVPLAPAADNLATGKGFESEEYIAAITALAESVYPEAVAQYAIRSTAIKENMPRAWKGSLDDMAIEAGFYAGFHLRKSGVSDGSKALDALEALVKETGIYASSGFQNAGFDGWSFKPPSTDEVQTDLVGKTADEVGQQEILDAKIAKEDQTPLERPAEAQSGDDLFASGGQLEPDLFDAPSSAPSEYEQIKAHGEKFYAEQNKVKPESEKKTIVLIACCAGKAPKAGPAREMYQSQLFKASLKYADSLNPDAIYVLSAKHGLVGIDEVIEPYDETLKGMRKDDRESWSRGVLTSLEIAYPALAEKFVILAGNDYRENLVRGMGSKRNITIDVPLEGLGIGEQLAELKRLTQTKGERANNLVENIPEGAYAIGDEYFWSGFKVKVTGIERPKEGRPTVLLEYTEGPLKGKKTDAPGHLKELQDDLDGVLPPFDIETTGGVVRISASWAVRPESYESTYKEPGGLFSIQLHGPDFDAMPGDRGRFRSVAGVPIRGTREQLADPAWLKDTAIRIANGALADHFGTPTRIIGLPAQTIDEVLERSRDIPAGQQPLNKIKITIEGESTGGEAYKITHHAKWWVDAIDKRLVKADKLRTCR